MARKKRDFDNPVLVSMDFKAGGHVDFAVSDYRVEREWLVLTRTDESRVTKYVSLDMLAKFGFDEPLNYRLKPVEVDGPELPLEAVGPISHSPQRDRMVAALQAASGQGVTTKKRVVAPKAVPEAPKIPEMSESEMIRKSMAGHGAAMMGS